MRSNNVGVPSGPRTATLNIPMNLAKIPQAMVVDSGTITGLRLSKVEGQTVIMVSGRQHYYVEQRMAKAFGYGVGDRVKVYEHKGQYYFSATKARSAK